MSEEREHIVFTHDTVVLRMLNHKELKRVDRAFAILRELVESNFADCDAQQRGD